jgi:hypothetical protein
MPPRLIYLDQNKWIELARASNGKADARLLQILEILRESKRLGLNLFPLSLAHFIETNKRQDLDSRSRLGSLMWELSDNWTLAGPKAILQWELDRALSLFLKRRLNERPFLLLGKGMVQASDHLEAGVRLDPAHVLPENVRLSLEKIADGLVSKSLLTGRTPWGERPPRPDLTGPATRFCEGLIEARERLANADPDLQRRTGYAQAWYDNRDEIRRALSFHGIDENELLQRGSQGLTEFLDSIPSIRIDMHLRLHWIRNRQLRTKLTDLNDWGYVAVAAAHCDVVVTEKQLADLLNRGLQKKATVITKLAELAKV